MSLLSVDGIKSIVRGARAPCVSLFMPTHRTGKQVEQDPIRLENLVKEAARQLEQLGHDGRTVERVLAPVRALIPDAGFWPFQSDGLAILAWDGGHVVYRLPIPFRELCIAGPRPHVKPLLPLLAGDGRFFVLTLSQNAVRLFEGGREGLRALDIHDIPASLAEVVGYDVVQKALQFRTPGPAPGGGRLALFYGQGAGAKDQKEEIEKFLRAVDQGVRGMLEDNRAPVVLVAAEPITSMFHQVSKLTGLLRDGPTGNFDHEDAPALFGRVWPHVEPRFNGDRDKLVDRVRQGLGTGKVVQRIEEVVAAARGGRIDGMVAALDAFRWGKDVGDRVEIHAERQDGDVDLVDLAAVECLMHGGAVYPVQKDEVPGDKAVVAAVLRF